MDVSAGGYYTVVLNSKGEVFHFGDNLLGQLGQGPRRIEIFSKEKKQRIIRVATGYAHCLALGENGKVYGWGDNDFDQMGRGLGEVSIVTGARLVVQPTEVQGVDSSILFCVFGPVGMVLGYADLERSWRSIVGQEVNL